jgi:hypothetical protein
MYILGHLVKRKHNGPIFEDPSLNSVVIDCKDPVIFYVCFGYFLPVCMKYKHILFVHSKIVLPIHITPNFF